MKKSFPYAFSGVPYVLSLKHLANYNIVPQELASSTLGKDVYTQFSLVFTNVLQAYQDGDEDYLKNVMEPKLFRYAHSSLESVRQQNIQLKYFQDPDVEIGKQKNEDMESKKEEVINIINSLHRLNQKLFEDPDHNIEEYPFVYEEQDMKINLDFRGLFGLRIKRSENEGEKYIKVPRAKNAPRQYFINLNDPMSLYYNQILVANVIFKTTRRLLAYQGKECIQGEQDLNKYLYHKWRFETYTPDLDWILTDVDDCLSENPYQLQS